MSLRFHAHANSNSVTVRELGDCRSAVNAAHGGTPASRIAFPRSVSLSRRGFVAGCAVFALSLAGCTRGASSSSSDSEPTGANSTNVTDLHISSKAWHYDSTADAYYQIGLAYCTQPQAYDYESMAIYVPGAYFSAVDNGDGTYTCTVDEAGAVGAYTAATAPIVIPVNTAGYSAQAAPTEADAQGVSDYLSEGLVYVYPGCRGRANGTNSDGSSFAGGAPWGCVDLKAAIRCVRYNADVLPGDTEKVVAFGMSGGGAQTAVLGASGDSALYTPYLEAIGAVMQDDNGSDISDALFGAMCWCPITELDVADEAYEWMMGQYATTGTRAEGTFTSAFSHGLAESFAEWVNGADIEKDGAVLTLEETSEGVYAAGSYYDAVKALIERSLNNFLEDTEFPYTPSGSFNADGGFAGGGASAGGSLPEGAGGSSDSGHGEKPSFAGQSGEGGPDQATQGSSAASSDTTYETVDDYIAALNADETWVTYNTATNTATVSSVGAFVRACKTPTKDVGAFDALDRGEGENQLFGTGNQDYAHFDAYAAELLENNASTYAAYNDWNDSYPSDYKADLGLVDDQGQSVATRANAYNPLYYLLNSYAGAGTSNPATHWRIRTGIAQGDTSLTTEMNLALALEACKNVDSVDFETVWGMGHTMAERTGSPTENFFTWLQDTVK